MPHLFRKKPRVEREGSNADTGVAVDECAGEDEFPEGVKVWADPGEQSIVDIVFVHGLTGDRERTWTHPSSPIPWPKAFLPSEFQDARIMTFGYDAYVVRRGVASVNTLRHHAEDFLHHLTAKRVSCFERPIILVAHSLGGLVCKDALLLSKNPPEPHLRDLYRCTRAIAFMGTPHEGSTFADWARLPADVLGIVKSTNLKLLAVLRTNSEILDRLQNDFIRMIRADSVRPHLKKEITCFCEALPMPGSGLIVSTKSAQLTGYSIITIHENHREMVKFRTQSSPGYEKLLGELARWVEGIRQLIRRHKKQVDTAKSEGLLNSLSYGCMDERRSQITNPTTGTCIWIFDAEKYRQWDGLSKSEDQATAPWLLWIKGKPGAGKSTMMNEMLEHRSDNPSILRLSFFFNARGSALEKSPLGLYRSLWYQILRQCQPQDPIFQEFLSLYDSKRKDHRKAQWRLSELCPRFHKFITSGTWNAIEIFIDALDECCDGDCRELVQHFQDTAEVAKERSIDFKICWSSRHYPHISVQQCLEIILDEENENDIERYVSKALKLPDTSSYQFLLQEIIQRASGVFLWAVLVIRNFHKAADQGMCLERPKTKTPSERGLMLQLTYWVLHAKECLSSQDIFVALHFANGIPHGECPQQRVDLVNLLLSHDEDRFAKYVRHVSGGLFEVSNTDHRVHLIHESVQQYLMSTKGMQTLGLHSIDSAKAEAQKALLEACRNYLRIPDLFHPMRPRARDSMEIICQYLYRTHRVHPLPRSTNFSKYVVNHYPAHAIAESQNSWEQSYSCLDQEQLRRDVTISWVTHCVAYRTGEDMPFWFDFFRLRQSELAGNPKIFMINAQEFSRLQSCFVNLEIVSTWVLHKFNIAPQSTCSENAEMVSVHEIQFDPRGDSQDDANFSTRPIFDFLWFGNRSSCHNLKVTITTSLFAENELALYLSKETHPDDRKVLLDWVVTEPSLDRHGLHKPINLNFDLVITRILRDKDYREIGRHGEGDVRSIGSRSHYRDLDACVAAYEARQLPEEIGEATQWSD